MYDEDWEEPLAALAIRRERNGIVDKLRHIHDRADSARREREKLEKQAKEAQFRWDSILKEIEKENELKKGLEDAYRVLTARDMKFYSAD